MSRFEAAAKKAAGASAPKAKAKPEAKAQPAAPTPAAKSAAVAKAKPAAAKPVLTTLDEKKKWVNKQEHKIEDCQYELENEPNKSKKKEIEAKLKSLKSDETYVELLAELKQAELQAKKDAERAAINAVSKEKKGASAASGESQGEKGSASIADANADMMDEIDKSFASSGKDAAAAKASAVAKMEALASCTPFVLCRLEKLIGLFADSKLGTPAQKACKAVLEAVRPEGHCIAQKVVPLLLEGMDDKRWKVKQGCIEILGCCLRQMQNATPAQLAECLPDIVTKLATAALEVRAEVRNATGSVLREIGTLVSSPEIQKLSADLVTALADPTNQKHTQGVLAKMGNQTFMSLIDPASLALLMPIVVRGLKATEGQSKKWSAQIFGSTSMLVKDAEMCRPYMKTIVPVLQELLTDPVPEVQREAAKCFGILEQVMPEYSRKVLLPWLFGKLSSGGHGEQIGAALALAEVFVRMEKANKAALAALMPEIQTNALDPKWATKRGYLELMDATPQAMKMPFTSYLTVLFPVMLLGITGDKEAVDDPGHRASVSVAQRYGDLCPELLLPAIEGVYCATLKSATREEAVRNQVVRERTIAVLGKVVDKILEHKKFGQDLLTTDGCSTKDTREYALCLAFAMRQDPDPGCKRVANGAYKNAGGAPKIQKAISAALGQLMMKWRSGVSGAGAQSVAVLTLVSLAEASDLQAPEGELPAANDFSYPEQAKRAEGAAGEDATAIVRGDTPPSMKGSEGADSAELGRLCTANAARDFVEAESHFTALPTDIRNYCSNLVRSVAVEAQKNKSGGKKLAAEIASQLKDALNTVRSAHSPFDEELPLIAESAARVVLGDAFDAVGAEDEGNDATLLHVESLLLMYGAGHLLLRDTTLTMKKNQCYGVVGENGAGKTTLMKEIADHRVVGMPQDLKCVHVDDSKLGMMSKSSLTVLEYAKKMAIDIGAGVAADADTLLSVGFTEKMLQDPVSELSTGWRMRLTLGVSMLKNADLVLLDEPTNHLDEESVAWLANYVGSIKESSCMVISHEPKFLNKICTHILAYVDKKLEYTAGNFEVFAAKKGLSKEQLDQMLSGNLSFNTKSKEELEAEEESGVSSPKVAAPVSGPPKLSFPIPGAMEGVKSSSKSVLEIKNLSFRYGADKDYLFSDSTCKLSLNSRVAICGRNGCGKSTLMTLLCSEMSPTEGKDGKLGEVYRHQNLRLAYMKQDHLKALGPFFDTTPFVYITTRFKDGYDGELQKRLTEPEDEEAALRRAELAKKHGKYGKQVADLVSRTTQGKTLMYEVAWEGLDDAKQNTMEPISKLKQMGLDKVVIACDERIAAKAAGLDQRPLTRREVVKHVEAFGIDEEMCCNRQIRGFSAGQKVRLSLAAMFWTKPHLIAVDEPTNYLDVETVDALAKALINFRGGIVMIEPKTDFVERICNERWQFNDGEVTVEKMKNANKRQA